MLKSLTPNLMAEDVSKSIQFYTEVLGLELVDEVPHVFAILGKGDLQIMLENREALIEEYPSLQTDRVVASLSLFIKVADIQTLYETVSKKTKILKEMNKTFYGSLEFAIEDPDGTVITFAETNL